MSLSIKLFVLVWLLFVGGLSGADYILEMNAQTLNRFPHKSHDSRIECLVNARGDAVWPEVRVKEHDKDYAIRHHFYWSEKTGVIEIDIDDAMHHLEREDCNQRCVKHWEYSFDIRHLDNKGNVFLNVRITLPDENNMVIHKVGVWNHLIGFKMLKIPNIDIIKAFKFSDDRFFVRGENLVHEETFAVLSPVGGRWPWEPEPEVVKEPIKQLPETTPWDGLPFGKHSSRLHIIQQLIKKTKDPKEKKTIMLMAEGEIANILDLMQYDLKRAQALLKKAKSEGKDDPEAEKLLTDTKKHMAALKGYLKNLPKANKARVDAIYLPSKDWLPNP